VPGRIPAVSRLSYYVFTTSYYVANPSYHKRIFGEISLKMEKMIGKVITKILPSCLSLAIPVIQPGADQGIGYYRLASAAVDYYLLFAI
jgi:hypothetical protein